MLKNGCGILIDGGKVYSTYKKVIFCLLISYCSAMMPGWNKLAVAAPFVVSNYIITGYCLCKVYDKYLCIEKVTKVEKCKQAIFVVASAISIGYSTAFLYDNLS